MVAAFTAACLQRHLASRQEKREIIIVMMFCHPENGTLLAFSLRMPSSKYHRSVIEQVLLIEPTTPPSNVRK